MASFQTNAILASSAAANLAAKTNTPAQNNNADPTKFSDMLTQAQPDGNQTHAAAPKTAAKSGTKPRQDVSDKKADATHTNKKTSAKSDNNAPGTADAANASDNKASAKTDTPPKPQTAATSDDDSTNENAVAANAQPGNTAPVPDQGGKKSDQKDAAAKTDATDDPNQIAATAAAAPQTPPAAVQMQQAMAQQAITPPAASQPPATPGSDTNIDGIGSNAAAKPGRAAAQTPRAPQAVNDNETDDADGDTAITPQTPISAAQASLKSAGHDNGKIQTAADTVKNDASQPQPDASQPAPAAPPPPSAANIAGTNPAVVATAQSAAASGIATPAAANTNVTSNVHVAPQGATPNVNGLAVEIAAKSQSGSKEFQIRLDPPELGHVEVRLSIDATGKTEAHVTADQPQTLHLLQKDSGTLTSALRNAGLDVSQDGLNFSLKGQDRNSGNNGGGAQARTPSMTLAATKTIDAAQSASAYLSSAGNARLDIHV